MEWLRWLSPCQVEMSPGSEMAWWVQAVFLEDCLTMVLVLLSAFQINK